MTQAWLPHPILSERQELFRKLRAVPRTAERLHVSDFLALENIRFFPPDAARFEVVDALLAGLLPASRDAARQAVRQRETDLPLRISGNTVVLRGRLPGTHHLRLALGLIPQASPLAILLMIGPVDQNRLHAGMLVAMSALFSRPAIVRRLVRQRDPGKVYRMLRDCEFPRSPLHKLARGLKAIRDFFLLHFAGALPQEEHAA